MSSLIVVSNRIPSNSTAAGGLAVALKKVLQKSGGRWYGWSTSFCRDDKEEPPSLSVGGVSVQPIDLPEDDFEGYYQGYSNSVLWPAFHHRIDLISYKESDYFAYRAVNKRFAKAVAEDLAPDQMIWVHDYHLIPLAYELRQMGVTNPIGFFLHIPVPGPEMFSSIPHYEELLDCLGEYDLVGLQAQRDVDRLEQAYRGPTVQSLNDARRVTKKPCAVSAFPIGTDPEAFQRLVESPEAIQTYNAVEKSLVGRKLILGVDRLDYSKGIPERIRGYEQLLSDYSNWRRQVQMLQISPPSREAIEQYQMISDETDLAVGQVIGNYSEPDWNPLSNVRRAYPQVALAGLFRLAKVGLVTPLRDGMNLVAHEYVACQDPEDPGVLVLSRFAGAAEVFDEAILVNPHDSEEMAFAINLALEMPLEERKARWRTLMGKVRDGAVDIWSERFLSSLARTVSRRDEQDQGVFRRVG